MRELPGVDAHPQGRHRAHPQGPRRGRHRGERPGRGSGLLTPPHPRDLLDAARGGEPRPLARLISLVEGGDEQAVALARAAPGPDATWVVGLTGAPGAGKSTLAAALVGLLRRTGERVAVLAVDPSSPFSGGALLGDRVRMQEWATDPGVFVRSMASRGASGGLAAAVPDAVRVLAAASWPWVLVETVGVGQGEIDVASVADTTLVLVTPGWGDDLQAEKAGLLEVADVFVVNKADRSGAAEARAQLEHMLSLADTGAWRPPVVEATATTGAGVPELWGAVVRHRAWRDAGGQKPRVPRARPQTWQ
ncbi:MAG TPA: methylmalonyl Co-A mutase-associated GTPase MeaB [Acidimicrobiales bacterium]|nr:methylmalonyl Co-A mutase-associated GTPase MeaB [Acidimicrobiales bacterium]